MLRKWLYTGAALLVLSLAVLLIVVPKAVLGQSSFGRTPLTRINVTLLDAHRHPIQGATFFVTDAARHPLEDPLATLYYSGYSGQVGYSVPSSDTYVIRGYAKGYYSADKKVVSTARSVSITLVLRHEPPPPYPVTTFQVKVVGENERPIEGASVIVAIPLKSGSGINLGPDNLLTSPQGMVSTTVRAGGTYGVSVLAEGYQMTGRTVKARAGRIPLLFMLKPEKQPAD